MQITKIQTDALRVLRDTYNDKSEDIGLNTYQISNKLKELNYLRFQTLPGKIDVITNVLKAEKLILKFTFQNDKKQNEFHYIIEEKGMDHLEALENPPL